MMRLAHGYTNTSLLDGTIVTKRYQGTDAGERLIREAAALRALAGSLPVPDILAVDVTRQQLHTTYIPVLATSRIRLVDRLWMSEVANTGHIACGCA